MKDIIKSNYKSTVKRGLISPDTNLGEFIDKIEEEFNEYIDIETELKNKIKINEKR